MDRPPKGVYANRKHLKNGSTTIYYTLRGVGPLRPLPGDEDQEFTPRSAAFLRAYLAAIEAPKIARIAGTFQSISDAWAKSASVARLAPRTKLDYLAAKAKIDSMWGPYPLDVIEDPKIRPRFLDWRDEMGRRSPRQADAVFGVLRLILEWGRDRGLIGLNHATRPKKLYRADRSDKLWLAEQLDAFRAVASPQMRLALELALWTGQRQSDLLRLGWSSYDGKRLTLRQGKRRRKVDMPVAAPLKHILDNTPRIALTILTAPNGKPWRTDPKPTHFQHQWRKATVAAGIVGTALS